jgi:hypothetical protein
MLSSPDPRHPRRAQAEIPLIGLSEFARPPLTDIDGGTKKFFRARGWVGAFYKLNHAEPGDRVVIHETAPYRYRVSLETSDERR